MIPYIELKYLSLHGFNLFFLSLYFGKIKYHEINKVYIFLSSSFDCNKNKVFNNFV
jgi:hypothetical protein